MKYVHKRSKGGSIRTSSQNGSPLLDETILNTARDRWVHEKWIVGLSSKVVSG